MKNYHWVWLVWACAFLVPWLTLFIASPKQRRAMWWTSLATAVTGFTEPLFVPGYWNPPSLFDLAQRTGFDIESFIFAFAVGGIGSVLYNAVMGEVAAPMLRSERLHRRHRWHRGALLAPYATFILLDMLPWNAIDAAIAALMVGAITSAFCRPDLARKEIVGGILFLGLYALFMFGLEILAPGYIPRVWNLPALSGFRPAGIPLEELLFGVSFGMYWTSIYEHFTWRRSTPRRVDGDVQVAACNPSSAESRS